MLEHAGDLVRIEVSYLVQKMYKEMPQREFVMIDLFLTAILAKSPSAARSQFGQICVETD